MESLSIVSHFFGVNNQAYLYICIAYTSVGSLSDSGYEYLLKGYLMSGKSESRLLEMCMLYMFPCT